MIKIEQYSKKYLNRLSKKMNTSMSSIYDRIEASDKRISNIRKEIENVNHAISNNGIRLTNIEEDPTLDKKSRQDEMKKCNIKLKEFIDRKNELYDELSKEKKNRRELESIRKYLNNNKPRNLTLVNEENIKKILDNIKDRDDHLKVNIFKFDGIDIEASTNVIKSTHLKYNDAITFVVPSGLDNDEYNQICNIFTKLGMENVIREEVM